MDTQRWSELRHLFDTAADLPPHAWNEYLLHASSDAALRCEVIDLLRVDQRLRAHDARADRGSTSAVMMAAQLASVPSDPRIGSIVGPWRILRVLGQGSGGIAYLAESASEPARGRVALKLPHPGVAASVRARFRTERDVLRTLRRPGIVRLLDADIENADEPCLVFECIDGRDVRRHCALLGLGPVARAALFLQICDIVASVHADGVAHRDLRAQNILVTRDGGIALLDFGRATWLAAPTVCGDEANGEPSNETASGDDARDAMIACDVRALALLLGELWQWPGSDAVAWRPTAHESALAAVVARALAPGHTTLADLADELRASLRLGDAGEGEGAPPFMQEVDAGGAALLHCTLAKSARQSRCLFGGVEESPGSAGQSAR